MRLSEHEPQRPRPPDLYIRGRADRSSADLSAQPEANWQKGAGRITIRRLRVGASSDNPMYIAARERLCEGMRLTGASEE